MSVYVINNSWCSLDSVKAGDSLHPRCGQDADVNVDCEDKVDL